MFHCTCTQIRLPHRMHIDHEAKAVQPCQLWQLSQGEVLWGDRDGRYVSISVCPAVRRGVLCGLRLTEKCP